MDFIDSFVKLSLYIAIALTGIYRIWFDSRSKFPGPTLAAASCFPFAYHRLRGDLHKWTLKLHLQYGLVVRVAPNVLSYSDPKAWKDVYGFGKGDLPKEPSRRSASMLMGTHRNIAFGDDEVHARHRRAFNHAVSDKAFREQEALIARYVDALVDKIRVFAEKGERMDMLTWVSFATFDVMSDVALGKTYNMLEEEKWNPWIYHIFNALETAMLSAVIQQFFQPVFPLLMALTPKSVFEPIEEHKRRTFECVDERIARGTTDRRKDMWAYILANNSEKESLALDLEEMRGLAMGVLIAGTETVASGVAAVLWGLITTPSARRRLQEELRKAFPTSEDISMTGLTKLPYLQACVEEGLRMNPPNPQSLDRIVPSEGRTICGEFVPGGTVCGIPHWATFNSPDHFHNANTFAPERWLKEDPESPYRHDHLSVVNVFSYGPRNCAGKAFAHHELRSITAKIFYHFDLELCDESKNWTDQRKFFSANEKQPLFVVPVLRHGEQVAGEERV